MADDVFALSPISASPAQPSEADYEAIRDAFMETSRGRWFLGEYAKRNRNADTSMVLDAVARIEQALAAQQRLQQQQEMQAAQEAEASALPAALAAIRNAVTGAEGATAAALDRLALEESLAPVRKGVRIIREISWRWREIGADSRICDLIDSQIVAIEAACDQLVGADPRAALIAAFDMVRAELDSHDDTASAMPMVGDEIEASAPEMELSVGASPPETASGPGDAAVVRPAEAPAAVDAPMQAKAPIAATPAAPVPAARIEAAVPANRIAAAPIEPATEVAVAPPSVASDIVAEAPGPAQPGKPVETQAVSRPAQALVEPVKAAIAPAPATDKRAEVVDEFALSMSDDDLDIVVVSKAEADALDEALLDLVAAEMGAPDPIGDKISSSIHFDIEDPVSVDDDIVATFAEPTAPEPSPEQPIAATPPAAPSPPALPTQVVAAVPEPRPATVAKPEPTTAPSIPVAGPPAPTAQAPAPVMQQPAKAAPVVQEKPAPVQEPRPTVLTAMLHPLPKPLPQPSLGATLLANGLLQRPLAANDPLTPIRRMTQPEKIAFFS
jgi:hypothetical protein